MVFGARDTPCTDVFARKYGKQLRHRALLPGDVIFVPRFTVDRSLVCRETLPSSLAYNDGENYYCLLRKGYFQKSPAQAFFFFREPGASPQVKAIRAVHPSWPNDEYQPEDICDFGEPLAPPPPASFFLQPTW